MDRVRWADARLVLVRLLGPALILCGITIALGFLVVGPLAGPLTAEDLMNSEVASHRSAIWDGISAVWSYLGSTEMVAGGCLVISGLVWWRTRDWRLALVPVISVAMQLCIYLTVTAIIRRERPSVDRLETLLPMSSYPSGHVGASIALYLSLILTSHHLESVALRRLLTVVAIAVPTMVAFGRFYRGMHHPSDMLVGSMVGVGCALLAYGWYRRGRPADQP